VINITNDLDLDAIAYKTIITEQAPSPPKDPSPLKETTIPSQPTSPEPMQLDLPHPSKKIAEPATLTTKALSQKTAPSIPILITLPSVEIQRHEIPLLVPILQILGT
jgi:hypothetical protein